LLSAKSETHNSTANLLQLLAIPFIKTQFLDRDVHAAKTADENIRKAATVNRIPNGSDVNSTDKERSRKYVASRGQFDKGVESMTIVFVVEAPVVKCLMKMQN
jgi:hypothetical protein